MKETISQFSSMPWYLILGTVSLLLLWGGAQALEWMWFKPRRLDQILRNQGLRGTVYRSFAGDMKDENRLNKEACAKPMPFSHDISARILPLLYGIMKEYGKQSFTWFGQCPRVTITDPELVREVLSDKCGHIEKTKLGQAGRMTAEELANYKKEKWAKERRILNPAFHVENLKSMIPAFYTSCGELVDRWINFVGSNGSFELDVLPELQKLARGIVSEAAFGSSYQEGRRIFDLQAEQGELLVKILDIAHIPFHWYLPTKINKRLKEIGTEIRTLFEVKIAERERAIKNGEATQDNVLSLLLESNMREMVPNRESKSSVGLTTEEVIQKCQMFFAGSENMTVLLTWTLVLLSMHLDWQEKAREEVLSHFGREKPTFDGLNRLKIVNMIIYEVLRLYPPIVTVSRRIYKRTKLGNITYPPGVLLVMPIILIHHDTDIWGPDATEFKPTRFAEGISKATKDSQVAFFPFGWGPHNCIGQNLALLEAKIGLSMILQHFKFELSEKYLHAPYTTTVALRPEHSAPIKFCRI
ncbi:cytochrome P450 CYP72A219-like protein [Carex littledalei]|uniref:Cytochrome P450 CYP72A219-like protein n=1 Tax=Carex littledalei TaxID=544730 RepID=A0A833REQ8_9POAL|nr:cytochrome P450 CYP72A219-like protein [Carex littledalei]